MVNNILHRCITVNNQNFRFSPEAAKVLTERGVSPAEIWRILENPNQVLSYGQGQKTFFGDHHLFVTETDGDVNVVIRVVSNV